jgi:hypothetical protein
MLQVKLTIDVAKATCFALLCVMQTASPVDGDVAFSAVQPCGTLHAASGADTTKLEQAVEDRTVVADVVLALLLAEVVHVVRSDALEEIDVFVGVELGHFVLGCWFGAVDLQVLVETVVHDERVSHANTVRLHGVSSVVGVVSDVTIVEIGHLLRL